MLYLNETVALPETVALCSTCTNVVFKSVMRMDLLEQFLGSTCTNVVFKCC